MGWNKSSSKEGFIETNAYPQGTIKFSNKQPNFTHYGIIK